MVMWMVQSYVTEKNTYQLVEGKGNRETVHNGSHMITFLGGLYIVVLVILAIGIPYFSSDRYDVILE